MLLVLRVRDSQRGQRAVHRAQNHGRALRVADDHLHFRAGLVVGQHLAVADPEQTDRAVAAVVVHHMLVVVREKYLDAEDAFGHTRDQSLRGLACFQVQDLQTAPRRGEQAFPPIARSHAVPASHGAYQSLLLQVQDIAFVVVDDRYLVGVVVHGHDAAALAVVGVLELQVVQQRASLGVVDGDDVPALVAGRHSQEETVTSQNGRDKALEVVFELVDLFAVRQRQARAGALVAGALGHHHGLRVLLIEHDLLDVSQRHLLHRAVLAHLPHQQGRRLGRQYVGAVLGDDGLGDDGAAHVADEHLDQAPALKVPNSRLVAGCGHT